MQPVGSPAAHEDRDPRRELRWKIRRMALVRTRDREHLAVTCDVSFAGLRLAVVGMKPQPGDFISADLAFDHDLIGARGKVVYVMPRPWGSLVGVRCSLGYEIARRFIRSC